MSFQIDGQSEFDNSYRTKPGVLAEINMTPFVDICLVLLIIFMITAPFAVSSVQVNLPKSKAKVLALSPKSIILSVTKKGEFYLDSIKIPLNELSVKLKALAVNDEQFTIFIRADKNVSYEKLMLAMSAAQNAGISRIGMIGEKF